MGVSIFMANVYDEIKEYYQSEDVNTDSYIPRRDVERFFQRRAWSGETDERLREEWSWIMMTLSVLQVVLSEDEANELTVYDYQDIVYEIHDVHPEFTLDAAHIDAFIQVIDQFAEHIDEATHGSFAYESWGNLKAAQDSFYVHGEFVMPDRIAPDSLYRSLDRRGVASEEDMDKLNSLMDNLLDNIRKFYHQEEFQHDWSRAMVLATGGDPNIPEESDDDLTFWPLFYDYFLFDYHLFETDETPIEHYAAVHKDTLSDSEKVLLRDLQDAEFTIFYADEVYDGGVHCINLMNGDGFEMAFLPVQNVDCTQFVFIGHIQKNGIVMFTMMTTVEASPRLRVRMKEQIEKLFAMYQYQEPEATMDEFLRRHAIAARHVVLLLGHFAQLNLLKSQEFPAKIPYNEDIIRMDEEADRMLVHIVRALGYPAFSEHLLVRMFDDFMTCRGEDVDEKEFVEILLAILQIFCDLNGMKPIEPKEFYQVMGIQHEQVAALNEHIKKTLGIVPYDPRYLSESGFVILLYAQMAIESGRGFHGR